MKKAHTGRNLPETRHVNALIVDQLPTQNLVSRSLKPFEAFVVVVAIIQQLI